MFWKKLRIPTSLLLSPSLKPPSPTLISSIVACVLYYFNRNELSLLAWYSWLGYMTV